MRKLITFTSLRIRKQGTYNNYNMNSNLDEMRNEYLKLKSKEK